MDSFPSPHFSAGQGRSAPRSAPAVRRVWQNPWQTLRTEALPPAGPPPGCSPLSGHPCSARCPSVLLSVSCNRAGLCSDSSLPENGRTSPFLPGALCLLYIHPQLFSAPSGSFPFRPARRPGSCTAVLALPHLLVFICFIMIE